MVFTRSGGFLYHPPVWLPEGHSQTIWPALYARAWRGTRPAYRRERWQAPDGDFIDVDWLQPSATDVAQPAESTAQAGAADKALLVLFHGLEGSSHSHYALAFADYARSQGWAYAVPMFRGCSGVPNHAPRAYHSGDWQEIEWILQRLQQWKQAHLPTGAPLFAVGVSLGGNALLRWAQEQGQAAGAVVQALAAISAPLDLAACGEALHRGFSRVSYERMFLATMKRKAKIKWQQHPQLFDLMRTQRARSLRAFDDAFTAPLHGFANAADYWARASSRPHLKHIRVPALLLNAQNDPFVPRHSLPVLADVPATMTLWQPLHGGHVGFAQGRWPGHVLGLPRAVGHWLQHHKEQNPHG